MNNDNTGFSVSQFLTQGSKNKKNSSTNSSNKTNYNPKRNQKRVKLSKNNKTNTNVKENGKSEKKDNKNIENKNTGSTKVRKTRTTVSEISNSVPNVGGVEKNIVNKLPINFGDIEIFT